VRYLSAQDLDGLVAPAMPVDAIELALRDFAQGKVTVPTRQHLDCGDKTLLSMPVIGATAFGVKLVSVVPGNASRGLPVTNGLMMLSEGQTGLPLAVLNAAALTALRTGAVGALALGPGKRSLHVPCGPSEPCVSLRARTRTRSASLKR